MKHGGGSMMIWGCLTWNRTGRLCWVKERMDARQYCKILEEGLLGTIADKKTGMGAIIFQQDGDPKHCSKLATTWFEDHAIKVLPWAPSSPDINLIEHAWDALDKQLRRRDHLPTSEDQLWEVLQEEWVKLDIEYVGSYICLCQGG